MHAQPVAFEVTLEGDGLIGTPVFELGPGASGTYDILYSPITPGKQKGSITFVDEKVGEFWYELDLTALPAPPVSLPHFTAAVGYRTSQTITLENPINEEVFVKSVITNRTNFVVEPPSFNIAKYSSINVTITYSPSSVAEEESGRVRFVSPQLGEWVYLTSGSGTKPGVHPEDVIGAAFAVFAVASCVSPYRMLNVLCSYCNCRRFHLIIHSLPQPLQRYNGSHAGAEHRYHVLLHCISVVITWSNCNRL